MGSKIDRIRGWLSRADFPAIVDYAGGNRRILSFLTALTYDQDSLISWRAVEAIGSAASRIAADDPEYVRVHLRRLVWLLNDESGGIGWRAPEAMGEIIYHHPELFSAFIPILVNLMDMEPEDAVRFRIGWLWAMGRLAEVRPDDSRPALPTIIACLDDPDPQARGMAIVCLGKMGHCLPSDRMASLRADQELVEVYCSPVVVTVSIRDLVDEVFRF